MLGLKIHENPQFTAQPTMVAALPDMGNVAGIGISFLAKKLNAKLFAEIYSYWPPYVIYNDGVIDYSQASYKFYFVADHNIVIFTGDFSPTDPRRLYEICYEVLKMAERMDVKILYSIGAALRQVNSSTSVKKVVYCAVNRPEILDAIKKSDVTVLQGEGQITGFNGLIIGLAKERGMDAMCLLGEIDNPNMIQPKAAQAILQILIKILGISSIDMSELEEEEKRKMFMEQQMNYLEKVVEHGEPPGIA
ncbi:MAG TPA: PAC2 family protein [Nitrososphaeraceae archaeon]|nr:PAC2 family protein [Nitrososphaeraceae archaeon]